MGMKTVRFKVNDLRLPFRFGARAISSHYFGTISFSTSFQVVCLVSEILARMGADGI